MKTNVDRLLLVSKLKKTSILAKYIGNLFFIVKTKSSISTSIITFSAISRIMKTKFYVLFRHKYIETGPNCSHELDT